MTQADRADHGKAGQNANDRRDPTPVEEQREAAADEVATSAADDADHKSADEGVQAGADDADGTTDDTTATPIEPAPATPTTTSSTMRTKAPRTGRPGRRRRPPARTPSAPAAAAPSRVADTEPTEQAPAHLRRAGPPAGAASWRHPVVLLVAVPVLLVVLLVLAWSLDSSARSGQVMRNVEVGGRSVGGLGEPSLTRVVAEIADEAAAREVRVVTGDQTYETTAAEMGLTVDEEATAEAALDAGRDDPLLVRPFTWLGSFFGPRTVPVRYTVSQDATARTLAQLQGSEATAPAEPTIALDPDIDEFTAVPGRNGTGIDARQVAAELPDAAAETAVGPITIRTDIAEVTHQITDEAAADLAAEANEITADGLTLTVEASEVRVEPGHLRRWIGPGPPGDGFGLAIDGTTVAEELRALFADLPGAATDATVTLGPDGRPRVQGGQDGVQCCADDSAQRIWQALQEGEPSVTLEAETAEPEVTAEEAQEWGIVEPVGGNRAWRDGTEIPGPAPGFTTYYQPGEPRVTNIDRIADLVRGAVIPPGGTFSINDHVGERTTAKEFVEAGAIRDGQHVPEVGGGVSQFATTTFNAAYFAGLDIETYQAHSEYFARYPRGREATMGYPAPDLELHNTTPYGVLIWTSYTDTSLTVTMYSTPSVRAEQTRIAESRSGQCTNVETTRTRAYPDGTTKTDTFQATYRPGAGLDCNGKQITPPPEG